MSMKNALLLLVSFIALAGCSQEAGPELNDAASTGSTAAVSAVTEPQGDADLSAQASPTPALPPGTATVNELMNNSIDPAARGLWSAVSYVVTAEGTQETSPQSDADWNALRQHADALMQAAAVLTLPGLRVNAEADVTTPDFQFTPREIEAAIGANPFPWRGYTQDMQMVTLQILGAIERRDVAEYMELGVTLNQACDGCHAEYWYRPQPMRGAEGVR